jgi:hypothetical protein
MGRVSNHPMFRCRDEHSLTRNSRRSTGAHWPLQLLRLALEPNDVATRARPSMVPTMTGIGKADTKLPIYSEERDS